MNTNEKYNNPTCTNPRCAGCIAFAPMSIPANEWREEFKKKKQELKDWLYGTIYKGYDQEETVETVQQDVEDFFTDEWFENLLDTERARIVERNRKIVQKLRKIIDSIEEVEESIQAIDIVKGNK